MSDQEIFHALAGAGVGSGVILTLGKIFLTKMIKNLEESTHKMNDMILKMSIISVRLEILDHHHSAISKLNDIVQSHDKMLAILNEKYKITGRQ